MRSNKWLILGLVLSVGINVALIGFLAGRASHPGPLRNLDPTIGFMRILPNLPDQRRAELRPLLAEHFGAVRPSLRQMRQAQHELRRVIAADPFDPDQLAASLETLRRHLGTSQVASHGAFVRLVTALTPTERRLLIEILERPRQRRPRFPADGGRPDGKMPGATMDPPRVNNSSTHPVRRQLPGSLPWAD